eukprot:CAMPEP_0177761082 /NCGR_PEP_ID=MMETSP0491_2-20121128/5614_1 /TAXON_ID=63592 /ORGANISM="Tetraselmis chuii, Strain PLY429" /LENGTH=129 /DNA_ID=CAMNT_0019277031 /DNA_START=500 /DNA_END=887 /DNA_ORIENTATION=-
MTRAPTVRRGCPPAPAPSEGGCPAHTRRRPLAQDLNENKKGGEQAQDDDALSPSVLAEWPAVLSKLAVQVSGYGVAAPQPAAPLLMSSTRSMRLPFRASCAAGRAGRDDKCGFSTSVAPNGRVLRRDIT